MSLEQDGWRLTSIERRLDLLETTSPAVLVERLSQMERRLEGRINDLQDDVKADREELGTFRRAIIAAAISIASSALITALTVYLVFG